MEQLNIYNADIIAIKVGRLRRGNSVKLHDLKPKQEFIINNRYARCVVASKQYVSWLDYANREHSTTNTEQIAHIAIWNFDSAEVQRC